MYYYIYDNYLFEKKYQKTLLRIEARLTDLGINGKNTKLSILKNSNKTINDDLINNNIKTVVVIGSDKTFNQTINLIRNKKIIFGFIPIGLNYNIPKILDIPEGELACDILSARITKEINLGLINEKYYFITYLELSGDNVYINCDDNYFINTDNKNNTIIISNILINNQINHPIKNNTDYLNLIIKNTEKSWFRKKNDYYSYFKANKLKITSDKSIPILLIDEKIILKTPIKIELAKEKIKIIVGKKRLIN